MKNLIYILLLCFAFASCNSAKNTSISTEDKEVQEGDTIRISSEETEYEILIIEPGFNAWLISTARPEGYYSQSFLESRNIMLVNAYNQRVMQPLSFDPSLYEQRINYESNIDYGYDVNYKLYNYFIFFQLKFNQRLTGLLPRI